ncbi:radical SAM protein [Candidatus Aerophobetes bacterium]|uniref:Radical SAM protein n=1 Tax=Aerophobetes bacterium TaxID=2030807 RepID=A0A523VYW0_UNCAE|nr:MAG: radical SAM protein [Candidatus Aerophobetes bacterium]
MKRNLYSTRIRIDKSSLWKTKSPLLVNLDMELTERCNNNCIHCCISRPANDLTARERELSTEEVKGILEEAAALGCLKVRFTGGEPLLREDFEELYLFARRLGLKVLVFTNATLITPHLAELFARIPPLEKMEVSVYGMKRKSYQAITRVPGSYEAAWRGMNLLLERKVPFVVKGALLPPNREEMEEFEAWASDIPWMDKPPSYSMFFDLHCRRDSEEKNRLIKALRLSAQQGLNVLTRRREEYLRDMREFCSKFVRPPGENLFSCGAGLAGGCVDAYGHLQPCMLLRHPATIYDLKKGSLKDAITNFFPKVRQIKANNPDYLARCARCFLKGLCEQCPAKSWMEHRTLDAPVEYLCEIAHTQARYLGLLEEDERAWEIRDWGERIRDFSGKQPIFQERGQVEAEVCEHDS